MIKNKGAETLFFLNGTETERYEKFKKHKCKLKGKTGAIGGELSVTFTITGVGMFPTVKCDCGANKDLTDYHRI